MPPSLSLHCPESAAGLWRAPRSVVRSGRSHRLHCVAQQPRPEQSRRQLLLGAALGLAALAAPPLPATADADAGTTAPPPQPQGPEQPAAAADAAPENKSRVVYSQEELEQQAAAKLLEEEEERRRQRRRKKGRIRELEEIRAELAEKELVLLEKQAELLEKEQTVAILREELDIERKIRALLTKEKEKAEEEAALAMGLCTGGSMLP